MMYGLLLNFNKSVEMTDGQTKKLVIDLSKPSTSFEEQNNVITTNFKYLWTIKSGEGIVSYKYKYLEDKTYGIDWTLTAYAEVLEDVTIYTTIDSLKFTIPKGTTIDAFAHMANTSNGIETNIKQIVKTNDETYCLKCESEYTASTSYMDITASIGDVQIDEIHYITQEDLLNYFCYVLAIQIDD